MSKIYRLVLGALIAGTLLALASCGWVSIWMVELSGISISEATLTPAFDPEVFDYAATVPHATASAGVTVTTDNRNLAVTINDAEVLPGSGDGTGSATVDLATGENTVLIEATNGRESVTYTVVVTRPQPPAMEVWGRFFEYETTDSLIPNGSTIDFGFVFSPDFPTEIGFEIRNTGEGPLTLHAPAAAAAFVTLSGTNDGDYEVPTQPIDAVIPPGESELFVLRFTYASGTMGTKTATATLLTDDPVDDTFTMSLTGYGC